ncbi:flap endonuclease GEN homolog 1 [Denticeps clupeoides]|uniref:flap endonuclease GEN homolog 1 n=1 Tax=Denticeps clupeoides TaxID=299321 RepID=UPI0010A428DA|nr:flap endonuclease GEN homolog 1 [Denticeps clupeoides]
MGVTELWSILGPVRESVPLYSLTGKTLAVDLSLWVCEAQNVQAMMCKVIRPHLRNLFFRVSCLTLMGVKLVFVMEGEAPKIKAETMSKRTDMRFGGFQKRATQQTSKKSTSRGHFKAVLRECAEMLDCLGIPWVTAAGEAEAMCAFLDLHGFVDGCITNDGDAFLYGAQTVYRNFNMNTKDPQVDCYKMARVENELHLNREMLVGWGILLGCDYIPKGVPGVGKEMALKLIQNSEGKTLLQKFTEWRAAGMEEQEVVVKKVPHCHVCRHPGSAKTHERSGCRLCNSTHFCEPQDYDFQCPCDWHHTEKIRQFRAVEASVRKKTLACDRFPFTEVINEFLVSKDKPIQKFTRRKPNLLLMQKFALDKMEWPKHYTSEKVLVLMTYTELMNRKHGRGTASQIHPVRIYKPRVRNGISCFEIIWKKPEHYAFPEDQPSESQDVVRTVEEELLFRAAYPDVVDLYMKEKESVEESKNAKKKQKAKKENSADACDDVSDLMGRMSLQGCSASTTSSKPAATFSCAEAARKSPKLAGSEVISEETRGAMLSPLSLSRVIDQLHLSDIDWEALSFTSSPAMCAKESMKPTSLPNTAKEGCSPAQAERARDGFVSTRPLEGADVQVLSDGSVNFKADVHPPKAVNCRLVFPEPTLSRLTRCGVRKPETPISTTEPPRTGKAKSPTKFKFVRLKKAYAPALLRQQARPPEQPAKHSVCVGRVSSGEDSDAENRRAREKTSKSRPKASKPPRAFPAKPTGHDVSRPRLAPAGNVEPRPPPGKQRPQVQEDGPSCPVSPPPCFSYSNSTGNDSDVSIESPLPLAERLRRKLLK